MKKGLISIALSTAVLAGGLLGAAPANAATSNYDAQIKSLESKIQVEKWKIVDSKSNHATKYDTTAYNYFVESAIKRQQGNGTECVARGVEQFYMVVNKTKNSKKLSAKVQKSYNAMTESSLKQAKKGFSDSKALFKSSGWYLAASDNQARNGKSFKHKKIGMDRFFNNFYSPQSGCYDQMRYGLEAYTTWRTSASGNALTAADKATLKKSIDSLKKKSAASLPSEKKYKETINKARVKYDADIKINIKSLEKQLSSVKTAKLKASQNKK